MVEPVQQPVLLEVSGVHKRYRSRTGEVVEAVREVSFSAPKGQFIAIVGPSGCGKSTLLRMISGLLPYDQGHIRVNGRELAGAVGGRHRDVRIGIVFQKASLFPWLSVLANVLSPIRLTGLPVGEYMERSRELIALAGLAGFENRYPHELSGGMQQRVAICRSLIHDPDLLLMDEPFAALDAFTRDRLNLELQRIWQQSGKTIIFVTHNIQEAVFLADRVVVLGSRPATVLEQVPVGLERPRTLDTRTDPRFGALVRAIYRHFTDSVASDPGPEPGIA